MTLIIAAVDAIPDAFRTTLKVLDDLCGSVMVAGSERALRKDVFYDKRELTPDELTFSGLGGPQVGKAEPEPTRGVLDT